MNRTCVFAPLTCGKDATVMRCNLPDLKILKDLEEKMGSVTVDDILLGGVPEFDTLFKSCVKLPHGVERSDLDSEDVCEIADKFHEVNQGRFLERLQCLNVLLTLGSITGGEKESPQEAAMELLLGTLQGQLQKGMPSG